MNWTTTKLIAETLCLLTVAGSAAFFAWDMHQTQVVTRTAIYNVSVTAFNAGATVGALTGPCVDIQGDYICPPLTQLSQTEKNIGILAARSAQQVQQTATLVNAAAATLTDTGNSVKQVAGSLSGTAQAATATLTQAQTDLRTGNEAIAAFQPLITDSGATVHDLDTRINDPHITLLLTHFAGMSASGDATLADFHAWSHPFLNPDPCQGFKCDLKRYVWPAVQTVLGLGADANQIRILTGHPLPVTVH